MFQKEVGTGQQKARKKRDLAADLRHDWIQTFSEVKMDRHSPKQKKNTSTNCGTAGKTLTILVSTAQHIRHRK